MEAMRNSWTDDRLDDFRAETQRRFDEADRRMENGFAKAEGEIHRLRSEMNSGFDQMNGRFDEMNGRMDAKFDSLQRMMLQFSGTMIIALIGLIATQI